MSSYLISISAIFAINALMAYSVYLPLAAGRVNLGSAGFMAIGAYAAGYASDTYNVSIAGSTAIGAVGAMMIGLLIAHSIRRTQGVYTILITFAFAEVVGGIITISDIVGGAAGYPVGPHLGVTALLCALLVVVIFVIALSATRVGLMMQAAHDDENVARLFAVKVTAMQAILFVVGAGIAGLAGALYAFQYNYLEPASFGAMMSIYVLLYVLVGGTRSALGPLVGAALFSFVPELLRSSSEWRYVLFGILVIAVMVVRPQGLVGWYIRRPS